MSDQLAFPGLSGADGDPPPPSQTRAMIEILIADLESSGRLRRQDYPLAQLALDTAAALALANRTAARTGRTYAIPPLVKELREILTALRDLPPPPVLEGEAWESEVAAIERGIAEAHSRAAAFRDAEAS